MENRLGYEAVISERDRIVNEFFALVGDKKISKESISDILVTSKILSRPDKVVILERKLRHDPDVIKTREDFEKLVRLVVHSR